MTCTTTPTMLICSGLIILASAAPAQAQEATFIETFDDGTNVGNWTFGLPPVEVIQPTGGNPRGWLHSTCEGLACLDTFAPQLRTTPMGDDNEFTGNYRERGVTSVGVDLQTLYVDFSAGDRPLTVMLIHDNGSPDDFSDDWGAYFIGEANIPLQGEGWKSYDFDIPSNAHALPPGWQFTTFGANAPEPDWNVLIEDVSQLRFFYGDPAMFFIFQQWELGLDNARITSAEPSECPADLTGPDGEPDGIVNVLDLLKVIAEWGDCEDLNDCPADIAGSDGEPDGVVNVLDLLLVISEWGPCP